jgi:hypothetical protein
MDYTALSITQLRRECGRREIKLPKKTMKRDVIEALLEADDASRKVKTPPTPPAKKSSTLFPSPFVLSDDPELVQTPEDDPHPNPFQRKTTLVIGMGNTDEVNINKERCLFTGVKDKETLSWLSLTVNKEVPPCTFSIIVIYKCALLFNAGGQFDTRKYSCIMSTLKNDGEVRIVNHTENHTTEVCSHLISSGYGSSTTHTMRIGNNNEVFLVYRKGERDISMKGKNTTGPSSHLSQDLDFEIDLAPPPPIREPGKYTSVAVDIAAVPLSTQKEASTVAVQETGITVEQFTEEVKDREFIERFTTSVKDILKYKIRFYKVKLTETKKEFERVSIKVQKLKIAGVSATTIKEMYPMFDFYAGFIVELEELLGIIITRLKTVEPEEIQKNLRDALDDPVRGLASIIGREDVKDRIACQLYAFSKSYKTFTEVFNNICLMGPAGVGKTALAKVIGFVFSKSGILGTDNVKIVSRSDMVGQYVGSTAPRTKGLLLQCLEGVLFIDEAYQLTPEDPGRDFGPEAITEIVNFLDKYCGMGMVMVAGYEIKMMREFFPSNEGLSRRFPYRMILRKYNPCELTDILIQFIERKSNLKVDEETGNYLYSLVESLDCEGVFTNQAGDMLNMGSSIVTSVNGSYAVKWKDGDLENNKPILHEGLNDYLFTKGMHVV